MSVDLSKWMTKPEAAARMGISERTLDRRCESGTGPERRERGRTGMKPEPVYNRDDVERMAAPMAHRVPDESAGSDMAPRAQLTPETFTLVLERIAGGLESVARSAAPPVPQLAAPRAETGGGKCLTLAEASEYSGLSICLLRRMIRGGSLFAFRDRATKVRTADVDSVLTVSELSKYEAKSKPPVKAPKSDRAQPPSVPEPSTNDLLTLFSSVCPMPEGAGAGDAEGAKAALTAVVRDA